MIKAARFADLTVEQLYGILRLRAEVFVVEQECAYLDPDGRDAEPGTWHLWADDTADDAADEAADDTSDGAADAGAIAVAGRLLDDGDAWRIGRIATAHHARGRGLAAAVVHRALELCDDGRPVVLDAQSHLVEWYGTFGFEPSGPEFVEDGIPHTPMRLVI